MSISELILRLLIAYFTLLVLARLIGRKEVSQMTFLNFISAISIGTIGASLAIDSSLSIQNGLIALSLWSVFTIVLGYLDLKSKTVRKFVEGQPVVVIRKGEILKSQLFKVRLDIDALNALLRQKNVFSITDVDYAIFETDGKLSVLLKESSQLVTKKDMNIQQTVENEIPIPTGVISNGKIIKENIKTFNINLKTIEQQLQQAGVTSISDVFYAELQKDGTLHIDLNNKRRSYR